MIKRQQKQNYDAAAVKDLLSCQPRVTVTSCFVYTVIRDLESIDSIYLLALAQVERTYVLLNNCKQNTTSQSLLAGRTVNV